MNRPMHRRRFNAIAASALATALDARSFGRVPGSADRLRVGAIGCGSRGSTHMATLLGISNEGGNVEVAAVCDTYRPRLEKAAARMRAEFKTMLHEELIAR